MFVELQDINKKIEYCAFKLIWSYVLDSSFELTREDKLYGINCKPNIMHTDLIFISSHFIACAGSHLLWLFSSRDWVLHELLEIPFKVASMCKIQRALSNSMHNSELNFQMFTKFKRLQPAIDFSMLGIFVRLAVCEVIETEVILLKIATVP